jgi:2-oxoglutarate dehydrogenase complex dehydrogenase (E1) component-like enzyme
MSTKTKPDINSWLEDELYQQYLHDHQTVDESWISVFEEDGSIARETNGAPATAP